MMICLEFQPFKAKIIPNFKDFKTKNLEIHKFKSLIFQSQYIFHYQVLWKSLIS